MKIRVAKDKMLEGLQQVQSVISTRTTLPILQNVLLQAKKGKLELSTTDLDVGVTCQIEAQVSEEGGTTLPARRLLSIFRELPSHEIDLEVDSKDIASIRSGQSFFKINGLSQEEFPPFPKLENARQITIEQALLKDMFKKTSYAISHDETRYVLNGVLMSFKEKKLTMVATDGRRLALTESDLEFAKSQEIDIIIPTKTLNEIQRLLKDEGDITLALTENKIRLELNGTVLVSKLIEGNYPNYRQVIPNETKERITLERETFFNTLRRVSLLTSEKSSSVKLNFNKDTLTLSSNTPEIGEARETLPIKYRGKELTIAFNPEYVMDALKNLSSDEIHMDFVDELSPGVMRIDTATFLYVIMPMRVA
ncbi:MAG: DNA polymerase III subunit beta [Verrucomicrobiae bacterium]|nr:DNA polymerase III subunit beta [Verrucomicrobiae bacterium]